MELSESVDLEIYTPACMAKTTDATTFDGKTATVAGWGVTAEGGQFPDPLVPHEVSLPVLPASECPGANGSPSDICAGGSAEGGKDSCQVGFIDLAFTKDLFLAISPSNLLQIQKVRSVLKYACSDDFKSVLTFEIYF